MRIRAITGLFLFLVASSVAPRAGQGLTGPLGPLVDLAPPLAAGASLPNLATDARGRVWLSWLEPLEGGGHRFRLASLDPGTGAAPATAWSQPITVAEGTNFLANWADFPSVFVARDGTLAAHWLERGTGRMAYGIRLRTSKDGGRTWTPTETPHKDPPAAVEHGFVSFFDAPGKGLGLAWLDGREMAGGHDAGSRGSMTIRAAFLSDGKAAGEQVIDARVCECCQTSAAGTSDGVIVAYRDRSDGEIRDIAVSRFRAGTWSAPAIVHADDWQIKGCPVNGPAVAASGDDVAVAWFSAKDTQPKLQVAFSRAGAPFGAPIRLDSGVTYGRLALVLPSADRALVSSIERSEVGPQLVIREARRDGRTSAPVVVAPMTSDRSSGFARMTVSGRRLIIAWTDVQAGAPAVIRVRAADLR
jgi:hypothetical protein